MVAAVREYRKSATGLLKPPEAPKGGLLNTDEMKNRIKEALVKPQYDVTDFYHETGLWQKIARNQVFENLTMAIIMLNAVFIAVDTDWNTASTLLEAHPFFQTMEHFFCLFFSFEWTARFMAFRFKRDCVRDNWFVFDSILVSMMVLETWAFTVYMATSAGGGASGLGQASILRLFRLLRLTRITRLMRMLPELMILVKGMVAGLRSVFTVMCLLMVVMYVFAIAFAQLADGTAMGNAYFDGVGHSLYTLLIHGVFLDSLETICQVLEQDITCLILFFIFVILSALTVMNMLIGVLCEVVSAVSDAEKDSIHVNSVWEKLHQVLQDIDTDNNECISKEEFMQILGRPGVVEALSEVDVDPIGIVDFADYIFESTDTGETEEISFEAFMDIILSLRGSNHVTVKDVVDLRKQIVSALEKLEVEISSRVLIAPNGGSPASSFCGGGAPSFDNKATTENGQEVRRVEVQRLEEQVGRAEGLLDALSSEIRVLGERLQPPSPSLPPPPCGRPDAPWASSQAQADGPSTAPTSWGQPGLEKDYSTSSFSMQLTTPSTHIPRNEDQLGDDILPGVPRLSLGR